MKPIPDFATIRRLADRQVLFYMDESNEQSDESPYKVISLFKLSGCSCEMKLGFHNVRVQKAAFKKICAGEMDQHWTKTILDYHKNFKAVKS